MSFLHVLFIAVALVLFPGSAKACNILDKDCESTFIPKEIDTLLKRIVQCQKYSGIAGKDEAEVKLISTHETRYQCNRVHCDISDMIQKWLPKSRQKSQIEIEYEKMGFSTGSDCQ